jgi:hypothetical protein
MRKPPLSITLALLAVALAPMRLPAQAATCPLGYTVFFFNGVANTYAQAIASMHATQAAIQETQNTTFDVVDSEDVQYDVAYNTTASQQANVFDPVNTTLLQDVAEVFVQRAQALDPSGTVGNNFFYMFWEWNNGIPQNYSNALGNNAVTNNFFANFVNAAVTSAVGALAKIWGSQAPTASDYAQQESQLTAAATAGRKLLLVAHSQGNLFVNHAHDFILPVVGAARLKVVHVAPATVTVWGDYELSFNDLIINGLRLVNGFASIVDPNINPPSTPLDPTGHGYTEIYLSPTLIDSLSGQTDRALLEAEFKAALTALDTQQCMLSLSPPSSTMQPGGQTTLTATLTPPVNDANLEAINYKWTITGNAGGTFTDPLLGTPVTTLTTSTPTVTYNAAGNAAVGQSDAVSVEMDVSTANNNNATSKDLADTSQNPAIIIIGTDNGCYDIHGFLITPGATYTATSTDQQLGQASTTIQETWVAKGQAAFADPPYATSGLEQDITDVFTNPASPANNSTNVTREFGAQPTNGPTLIYGSNGTATAASGAVTQGTLLFAPPVVFTVPQLSVGNSVTIAYAGTYTSTQASKSTSGTISYSDTWTFVGFQTVTVPAGTYNTCEFTRSSTQSPDTLDTYWDTVGYGIRVQSQTISTSGTQQIQDFQQATSVTVNGLPYTGP